MTAGRGGGASGRGTGSGPRRTSAGRSGSSQTAGGGFTGRQTTQKVRSAKGRKISSARWLQRQLNDPYVAEARQRGYRSRAAFKLIEIDDKVKLLKPGLRVLDLGAAPGGWSQVAAERVGSEKAGAKGGGGSGQVIALDLTPIDPLPGVEILLGDFQDEATLLLLKGALQGPLDAVLSDMAAPATGHSPTDHLRIMALAEEALDFAEAVLKPGGSFVAKVLQGGSEKTLLDRLKVNFAKVRHIKPPASRKDSAELYVVATGFRG